MIDNCKHGIAAAAFQLGVGFPLAFIVIGVLWLFGYEPDVRLVVRITLCVTGLLAIGFFIGVEWMQQVRVDFDTDRRLWPSRLSLADIVNGFRWGRNRDRYHDAGWPIVFCSIVALVM